MGDFFSSQAGQSSIGSGINALLGLGTSAFSANQQKQLLKGQANISAQANQSALAVEQERTRQAQLALQTVQTQGAKGSSNTMLYVALGIGGVVVLGAVIYAVTKK